VTLYTYRDGFCTGLMHTGLGKLQWDGVHGKFGCEWLQADSLTHSRMQGTKDNITFQGMSANMQHLQLCLCKGQCCVLQRRHWASPHPLWSVNVASA